MGKIVNTKKYFDSLTELIVFSAYGDGSEPHIHDDPFEAWR